MEQYEKSGPTPDPIKKEESHSKIELQQLEKLYSENLTLIKDLEREIRRINRKLDEHARVINQMKNNG